MPPTNNLDKFSVHEAMDRCHIVGCLIDDTLLYHPVVKCNPELYKLISKASKAIGDAYQLAGSLKQLTDP